MQVKNSLMFGMLETGKVAAGQIAPQGGTQQDETSQFESMLADRTQSRQEKPAPQKETNTAEKPRQTQDSTQETTEEGAEVAAGLVTTQPVVLFDVINVEDTEQAVQMVDPLAGMQEQAPVVQETVAPVLEQQPEQTVEQPVEEVPLETGFQQEDQQVPTVEAQPETEQVEVEVQHQESAVTRVETEQPEAVEEDRPEDMDVEDVYAQARPVFQRETATPVKVADNYEPVAPEEPEAPQQLADRLTQMLDQGDTRVEIALNPANLGKMVIEITRTQDGTLHVVLGAVSEKATALLQQNSANLHSLLAAGNQGEVHVQVQQQEPQEQLNQFLNPDEQGKQQQQQQQQKSDKQAASEDFIQQLRLGLVEKDEE